jgi:hypothetical protein
MIVVAAIAFCGADACVAASAIGSFTLTPGRGALKVTAGAATGTQIVVAATGLRNLYGVEVESFTVSGAPEGAAWSISPGHLRRCTSCTVKLTIKTDVEMEPGKYQLKVSATGTGGTRSANITLLVNAPKGTFTVSGHVRDGNGAGVPGVTIRFTRVKGSGRVPADVHTDAKGSWIQSAFQEGTEYRATPVLRGWKFKPRSGNFPAATSLNFTGAR